MKDQKNEFIRIILKIDVEDFGEYTDTIERAFYKIEEIIKVVYLMAFIIIILFSVILSSYLTRSKQILTKMKYPLTIMRIQGVLRVYKRMPSQL